MRQEHRYRRNSLKCNSATALGFRLVVNHNWRFLKFLLHNLAPKSLSNLKSRESRGSTLSILRNLILESRNCERLRSYDATFRFSPQKKAVVRQYLTSLTGFRFFSLPIRYYPQRFTSSMLAMYASSCSYILILMNLEFDCIIHEHYR